MKRYIYRCISVLFGLLFWGIIGVAAVEEDVQIGVQPIFPENQRDKGVGFFDLVLAPGAEQVIELEIANLSKEQGIVVLIEAATATTDAGGVVHYVPRRGGVAQERDSSLPFAFKELVEVPPSIALEPGEARVVPITIRMPDVPFDGLIAGGFGISQEIDLDATGEETGMIRNLFNFELPVLLRQNANIVLPELQILDVSASQWNMRNMIAVHLQNPKMMFINQMEIQATVICKDTEEVLYEHTEGNRQMAPNSNAIFAIPLGTKMFTEGNFVLHLKVESRNGAWDFVQEFQVAGTEAKAWNSIAKIAEIMPEIEPEKVQLPVWFGGLLMGSGLVLIGTLSHLLMARQKEKQKTIRDTAIKNILQQIKGPIALSLLFLVTILPVSEVIAKDDEPSVSFSVRPILPENQERAESTFFDLRMEPGQEQTIEIELLNHTDETILIAATLSTATTNEHGFAEYQLSLKCPDSTLPYRMEDIITVDPYVELKANESYRLPIHIEMPCCRYDGVWAGGLELRRIEEDKAPIGGIRNTYSYLTVILLHQGASVNPEVISHKTQVEIQENVGIFTTNFQNTQAGFTGLLGIETQIINQNTGELVYQSIRGGMQMVPHSNFDYRKQIEVENFAEGMYTLRHILESNEMSWEFEEELQVIGAYDQDEFQMFVRDADSSKVNHMVWVFVGVGTLVLLAAGLGVKRGTILHKNLARYYRELEQD